MDAIERIRKPYMHLLNSSKASKELSIKEFKVLSSSAKTDKLEDKVIYLNEGIAFGSQGHISTEMGFEMLIKYYLGCLSMLDIGVGNGILSILASKLGIKNITGIDVSEDAVVEARENLKLNNISNVNIVHTEIEKIKESQFDLIVLNVNHNLVIVLAPQISAKLKFDGIFIAPCIRTSKIKNTIELYENHGFEAIDQKIGDSFWSTLVLKKIQ